MSLLMASITFKNGILFCSGVKISSNENKNNSIMFIVIVYNSIWIFCTGAHMVYHYHVCKYGKYCDQNCSSHCNTSFECHQENGTCIGGCQDGWGSDKCDKGMPSTNFEIN